MIPRDPSERRRQEKAPCSRFYPQSATQSTTPLGFGLMSCRSPLIDFTNKLRSTVSRLAWMTRSRCPFRNLKPDPWNRGWRTGRIHMQLVIIYETFRKIVHHTSTGYCSGSIQMYRWLTRRKGGENRSHRQPMIWPTPRNGLQGLGAMLRDDTKVMTDADAPIHPSHAEQSRESLGSGFGI